MTPRPFTIMLAAEHDRPPATAEALIARGKSELAQGRFDAAR